MLASYRFVFWTSAACGFVGSNVASANDLRAQSCAFDEDCPSDLYCAGATCAAPLELGATCDRHAMCATGLCQAGLCGELSVSWPVSGPTREPKLVVYGSAPAGTPIAVGCGPHADIVVADSAGDFHWIPGVALPSGTHAITIGAGLSQHVVVLEVDTENPLLQVLSPAPDTVTANGQVTVRGKVEPGAPLQVSVDGQDTLVMADADGNWSFARYFTHGDHIVFAHALDAVGNRSNLRVDFTVDLEAPMVAIDAPADGVVVDRAPALITGRAEPGTAIFVDGHGAGTWLTVPADGAWSWRVPALADGTYAYDATAIDRSGWTSSARVTFTVDSTPPALAVSYPADLASTAERRPTFRGMADPGASVSVDIDDAPLGETLADASGRWAITPPTDLAEGPHATTVTATDQAGNTTIMTSAVTVDLTAPPLFVSAPSPRELGAPVSLRGTTEPRATLEARLEGIVVATCFADRQGDWSMRFDVPWQGEHHVIIAARDALGHTTEQTVTIPDPADDLTPAGGCSAGPTSGLWLVLVALGLVGLRRLTVRLS